MMFRFLPRSLKYRLLLAFLLGMVLIETAASYLAYRLMERHTWEEFDRLLEDKVRFYRSTLYFDFRGVVVWRMGEADWDRVAGTRDPDYFEIRLPEPDGRNLGRSKTLQGQDAHLPAVGMNSDSLVFADVTLPGGRRGRAAGTLELVNHYPTRDLRGETSTERIHIVVARSTASVDEALRDVRWRLLLAATLGTLSLLTAAFLIIRRNVRTVGQLSSQIETMPLDDPGQRFALPGAPSELENVVGRLNALMDRVTTAIENERHFTANAAHELRTPLAGMRSTIDAALTRPRTGAEYETTLLQLKDIQWKLQRMTENLLLLARLDAGQNEFGDEEVALKTLLRRAWKPYFDPALNKELQVRWQLDGTEDTLCLPVSVLNMVLRNLFQNAVDYSPEGGRIEIAASVAHGQCLITVANPNPGMKPEEVARMFQRFWRGDQSGDPNLASTGIGLALCQRIVTALGGSISADISAEDQIAVRFRFPLKDRT